MQVQHSVYLQERICGTQHINRGPPRSFRGASVTTTRSKGCGPGTAAAGGQGSCNVYICGMYICMNVYVCMYLLLFVTIRTHFV